MSLTDDYLNALKKRKKKNEKSVIAPLTTKKNEASDSDDIAPVAKDLEKYEKQEERKWFQKGAFEDGYQFGDVLRTINASSSDLANNITAGILGMGEKTIDAALYVGGGIAGLLGQNDVKEAMADTIAEDLYDEEELAKKIGVAGNPIYNLTTKKLLGIDDEEHSVFGEKADSVAQSGGQLIGQIGLQAVGVPWFVTSGVTSFGSEVESAFNEGAEYGEAGVSGLFTAGAEILTEKLSGGIKFGKMGTLDDGLTKALARGISNKFVRGAAKLGMDVLGEGAEEWLSEDISRFGQWLTYQDENTLTEMLWSEEAMDAKIEAFLGGAMLGGVGSVTQGINAKSQGRDAASGLTANEEAVFNKIFEKEVEAKEKEKGKKLTLSEKTEIHNNILEQMEKGYISTDTIEEVLGGDAYKSYKDSADNVDSLLEEEKALRDEFNTLNKMVKHDMTGEQNDRLEELRTQLTDIKTKIAEAKEGAKGYRSQLNDAMSKTIPKDRYLLESYAEVTRRGQNFEADLSQYDEKYQKTIQSAIDSGILNNSRKTHEFVDMVAKISADKGVSFNFADNEKIAKSSFAVEGAIVNGYKVTNEDGSVDITVNIESPKYLNSVVGHEITHVLEGTELYGELQKTLFAYAESKGELESRKKALKELYAEKDIDTELTADLVGDYLFADSDFINNLSVNNRNVFQKIYDEIKYLCKVATAGSKEARELEKVKKAFERAYREGKKTNEKSEGFYDAEVKHSLSVTDKETLDFLNNQKTITTYKTMQIVDGKLYPPMAARTDGKYEDASVLGTWEQATEHPELIKNGNKFKLDKGKGQGSIEAAYNPYMHSSNLVLNDQFSGAYKRDNLVTVECEVPVSELTSGYHAEFAKDSVGWHPWHTGTVAGQLRQAKGTERQVFLSRWIKPVRIVPDSEVAAMYKELLDGTDVAVPDNVVTPSLLQELKNVGVKIAESGRIQPTNTQYSLSDSDGKKLTKEQSEYFKDSKMRDDNGNLKVMYHGSQDAGFHIFEQRFSDDDTSFFFVDRNDVAASYSGTTETYEAQTIRTAEDMNKFIESIGVEGYEVVEKDGKFTLLYEGDRVADSNTAQGIYDEFCWYESVGEGDANYKVYLNLKNPLVIDAKGRNWNNVSREFSQELADSYNSLTAEERAALTDLAEWEDFQAFRDEILSVLEQKSIAPIGEDQMHLASAIDKLGGNNINISNLFSIASDNFSAESIQEFAVKQMNTRDYAKKAKAEGYDGVIFKNIVDNGGYSNGSEGASTVAIAFESNQIKSVANEKPTGDADIRYSLTEETNSKIKDVGLEYDSQSDTVSYSISSLEDAFNYHTDENGVLLNENDYIKARKEYVDALAKSIAVDKEKPTKEEIEKADRYLDGLFLVHEMIANDKDRLDYEAAVDRSAWVSNSEYGGSIDFSTLCAKRRLFTGTFDAIQNALPDTVLNENDFLRIRDMLLSKELESPCSMCYVEGSRAKHGEYVDKWLKEYLKTNPEWKPQIADFTSSTRLERTRIEHPEAYKEYVKAMNKLAQRKPKEASVRTDYKGEILVAFEDGSSVEIKNKNGGIRFNSFSDFEIVHALDCMQVITDMARVGLNGQAYTKVKEFAEAFGNTGLKINLSLVAKGVDENGKLIMDEVNGMKYAEAMDIRNRYSENVGTVIVVFDEAQLKAALADNTIDYVLPFHRSQWKKSQYAMMGLPVTTKDFTNLQNDRVRNPKTGKPVKLSKIGHVATYTNDLTGDTYEIKDNIMPNQYWDYNASARDNANRYLDYINENSLIPKFSFLLNSVEGKWELPVGAVGDGYYKLLIDFKMYNNDGWGSPQNPVLPEFNMPYIQQMLDNYVGGHQAFPVAHDVVEAFVDGKKNGQYSLSLEGETPKRYGNYAVSGKDIALEKAPMQEEVAPVQEAVTETTDDFAPMPSEPTLYDLEREQSDLENQIRAAVEAKDADTVNRLMTTYEALTDKINQMEVEESAMHRERLASLDDTDMPPETEAPYYESEDVAPSDPFENRDIKEVGNRKVKAYMYENPEVKPFFQEEAEIMLGELRDTTKGERFYTPVEGGVPGEYGADSYGVWTGTSRHTTQDIAYLLDECNYTYAEIEAGLKAIVEDNGKENNACSKRIEFLLNDRLMNGYQDLSGYDIPANQDYINLLNEKQITEYNDEARKAFFESVEAENIAPVAKTPDKAYEAIRPKKSQEPRMKRIKDGEDIAPTYETTANGGQRQRTMFADGKTAEIVDTEPTKIENKGGWWSWFVRNFVDKQHIFEKLSLETGNRELQAKANFMRSSESRAQHMIGKGVKGVRALTDIRKEVESEGLEHDFENYLYHLHNIDRMTLDVRFGTENKAVYGDTVTAEVSQNEVKQYEAKHPEFKKWAQDVYAYNTYLRKMLVDGGVISQETADLWAQMYPHYVPIRRAGDFGASVNVPLDTRKTGVNAPVKRAVGGNSDILNMFDTMAMRTEQTFRAIAKNNFGVELKNTLGTQIANQGANVDEIIDSLDKHEELLQEGKNGKNPTFTVFENGERVTFEISEEMYDALKPTSKDLAKTNKFLHGFNNFRRGLITEYNPVFLATNAIKDAQDILINSQHAAKTYAKIPEATRELWRGARGKDTKWFNEYMENGGEQNTYFDGKSNTFTEDKGIKKWLKAISVANNFVERAPRLAEYIASREAGASIESAMLDAARVTTNFAAGGDVTKFANRNGFTFLNASVQGAAQQVRNIREAKANGLKGWVQLAAKTAIAGIPALLLNGLLWDDDEDYEELSDYVKDNYYIVAKYGDGQFVRIPKGRTVAVIQDAFEQIGNALTGNDEVDLKNFLDLAISNLAPNNPLENHIFAPIQQALTNKTWYGEDLVPTRLQDLPASEQFDESTDAISKWLGEATNTSPIKWNYLLDQYSGGLGDVFLPMMTPEAERGDNTLLGNIIAPFKDKFTTDSTMNNQNVSDFYDTKDELTVNAKASTATDEDILMSKYINSVSSELGELYGLKREIQNSDLPDSRKYEKVRDIQDEINALARESLNSYKNVYIDGDYAEIGDRHYRLNDEGEWTKISDKQYDTQEDVTEELGISASDYWSNKSEYDFAYKNPEKYAVAKSVGGYDFYKSYMSDLYDIKADKDENGKSIRGSRKEKVADYVNSLDIDYGERLILFKGEYKADDTYNMEIINYLNNREDITYEEMVDILKELGFEVDSEGNVSWD